MATLPGGRKTPPREDRSQLQHRLLFPSHRNQIPVPGFLWRTCVKETKMNGIIYLVGLVVVVMAVLSFFGLR